ncbi:MAG: hypothetical protein AAFZ52_15980 [Bacteroidota bacterium]
MFDLGDEGGDALVFGEGAGLVGVEDAVAAIKDGFEYFPPVGVVMDKFLVGRGVEAAEIIFDGAEADPQAGGGGGGVFGQLAELFADLLEAAFCPYEFGLIEVGDPLQVLLDGGVEFKAGFLRLLFVVLA